MGTLADLLALAAKVRRIAPSRLSKPQADEWLTYANKIFTPKSLEATEQMQSLLDQARNAPTQEAHDALVAQAKAAEYKSKRYGMLDQAAFNIGHVRPMREAGSIGGDKALNSLYLPGPDGVPVGIANFYEPGHLFGDSIASNAAILDTLGASGEVPGTGRVLLKAFGDENSFSPAVWQSLPDQMTKDFYLSRGARQIPSDPTSELHSDNLPLFWVDRGSMIKRKCGGLAQMKGRK